jgi:hypothetical protein
LNNLEETKMGVHYEVPAGKTMMIAGPANVNVSGGEVPLIVDTIDEAQQAAPTITALDPTSVESGAVDIVLTVSGENFNENSVIIFGIHDEPTTLTPDGTLTTGVKPVLFAPATVPVSVRNGPAHSQSLDFTFTEPAGDPAARRRNDAAQKQQGKGEQAGDQERSNQRAST